MRGFFLSTFEPMEKAQMEYRDIGILVPLEDNPRTITPEAVEQLQRDLKKWTALFEADPIVLSDRTGKLVILSGNQRYQAAKAIKWKEVPTILFKGLTVEEEDEIMVIKNHSAGRWDFGLIADPNSRFDLSLFEDRSIEVWKGEHINIDEFFEAKEDGTEPSKAATRITLEFTPEEGQRVIDALKLIDNKQEVAVWKLLQL